MEMEKRNNNNKITIMNLNLVTSYYQKQITECSWHGSDVDMITWDACSLDIISYVPSKWHTLTKTWLDTHDFKLGPQQHYRGQGILIKS